VTEAPFEAEVTLDSAIMLVIGSTAALQGRHNYRMPLYNLAKALVPELVLILALELAVSRPG